MLHTERTLTTEEYRQLKALQHKADCATDCLQFRDGACCSYPSAVCDFHPKVP